MFIEISVNQLKEWMSVHQLNESSIDMSTFNV